MPHSALPYAPTRLQADLLAWYDANRREMPWRAPPGAVTDPYHVWLSEIMLQQTTVTAVIPYFGKFTERWPSVGDLAAAEDDAVMAAWAGLGYYARARNLLKCARVVAGEMGGRFPETEAALLALPGIGPYTAAAIAAIAFQRPANVVDGNIERVMARLHAVQMPLPAAKPELVRLAASLAPQQRPGDHAQALMDLGATICRPRNPLCLICPWSAPCQARAKGIAEQLPVKAKKGERPVRTGVAFWARTDAGAVLLRRRPPKGLLGGMAEIPSTDWREQAWSDAEVLRHAPFHADWRHSGAISHTFTHFQLELTVWTAHLADEMDPRKSAAPERCWWARIDGLAEEALPSVMRKVVARAQAEQD